MKDSTTGKLGPLLAYSEENGLHDFAFWYAAALTREKVESNCSGYRDGSHTRDGVCYRCPPETPGYRAFWKEVGR